MRPTCVGAVLTSLVLAAVLLLTPAQTHAKNRSVGQGSLVVQQDSLAQLPPGMIYSSVFSPDGDHFACYIKNNQQSFVFVDGVRGRSYDEIDRITFSPDSQHVAYEALREGLWRVVIDGREDKPYPKPERFRLHFSPDSQRLAYVAGSDREAFIVVNGVAGKVYDGVSEPIFSPDSRRLAYRATLDDQQIFVLDGIESQVCAAVVGIIFSPDSKHVAYVAWHYIKIPDGARTVCHTVVRDGIVGKRYRWVQEFTLCFSKDSQRMAYSATRELKPGHGGDAVAVIDGQESKNYGGVRNLTFSPNSHHVIFIARKTASYKEFLVVDGTEGPIYEQISSFVIGDEAVPRTKETAHRTDSLNLAYVALDADGVVVVVRGVEIKKYKISQRIRQLSFISDNQHVAYIVEGGGHGTFVVVNGTASKVFHWVGDLIFSLDRMRVAYAATEIYSYPSQVHKAAIIVDGAESQETASNSSVRSLCFSPDSQHLAYIYREVGEEHLVVDGMASKAYDNISDPKFQTGSKRVTCLARRGNQVWRLGAETPPVAN